MRSCDWTNGSRRKCLFCINFLCNDIFMKLTVLETFQTLLVGCHFGIHCVLFEIGNVLLTNLIEDTNQIRHSIKIMTN